MKLLTFSGYDEYKRVQVHANKIKYTQVYAEDPELCQIASHFRRHGVRTGKGLCHGVRNGYEVQRLRRLLPEIDIIGTDISDTAASLPHCIEWTCILEPDGTASAFMSRIADHTMIRRFCSLAGDSLSLMAVVSAVYGLRRSRVRGPEDRRF